MDAFVLTDGQGDFGGIGKPYGAFEGRMVQQTGRVGKEHGARIDEAATGWTVRGWWREGACENGWGRRGLYIECFDGC